VAFASSVTSKVFGWTENDQQRISVQGSRRRGFVKQFDGVQTSKFEIN
jgi:hypothetical protein